MADLTVKRARELLTYDPETGVLRWKVNRGSRARAGAVAGSVHNAGYRKVMIDYREYLVHRIAWLMQAGRWPNGKIDHINGVRDDNRWRNLRKVSSQDNRRNVARHRNCGLSGRAGVSWHRQRRRWQAYIGREYLGCHKNIADAITKREEAERKYGYSERHGKPAGWQPPTPIAAGRPGQ